VVAKEEMAEQVLVEMEKVEEMVIENNGGYREK
jgi:hypothetical protein